MSVFMLYLFLEEKKTAMNDDNIIPFKAKIPPKVEKRKHPPMINLPPVTKILMCILVGVHVLIWGISSTVFPALQDISVFYGGFIPSSFTKTFPFQWWVPFSFITYALLHGGWLHVIVNSVMLAAGGSGIERMLGAKKLLIIFFGSSVLAALTHFAFYPSSDMPIIGASGGISGLFGALIYIMQQMRQGQSLWRIALIWIGVSVITGMMGAPNGMPVAWLAHVGGFLAGIGIAMQLQKKSSS